MMRTLQLWTMDMVMDPEEEYDNFGMDRLDENTAKKNATDEPEVAYEINDARTDHLENVEAFCEPIDESMDCLENIARS